MKSKINIIISLLFILFVYTNIYADNQAQSADNGIVTVKTKSTAYTWNNIANVHIPHSIYVGYDPSTGRMSILISGTLHDVVLLLTPTDRAYILSFIKKYKKWDRKATRMKVRLDKVIGVIPLTNIAFYIGDESYISHLGVNGATNTVTFTFTSLSTTKHGLYIDISKLMSYQNKYITYKPQTYYLLWNDVIALEEAISDKAVQKYIKKSKQKERLNREFN